jgi:Ca-activated chloride channel family protein
MNSLCPKTGFVTNAGDFHTMMPVTGGSMNQTKTVFLRILYGCMVVFTVMALLYCSMAGKSVKEPPLKYPSANEIKEPDRVEAPAVLKKSQKQIRKAGKMEEFTAIEYDVSSTSDGENFSDGVAGGVECEIECGVIGGVLGASSVACFSAPHTVNTEEYQSNAENDIKNTWQEPVSTFSIDVDTASYATIRRFIGQGKLPDIGAIRIEEMINYFPYQYPEPTDDHPMAIVSEVGMCPWNEKNWLLKIGIKGKTLPDTSLMPSNLVFLIDVSGSMDEPNKLPLLKKAFKLLVKQLGKHDRIAMVVYAGSAGLVLPATSGDQTDLILEKLEALSAGGSTAGGEGIRLAYQIARENFISEGNNRVILATDGDFNVGISSTSALVSYIENQRQSNIYLTTLGFGQGNYKDNRLEQLANKGNGNYFYIDSISEAKKVLLEDIKGTLYTIANDVKVQIEFNPVRIASYRLIGYENRLLNKADFDNDEKDAGDIGAGHTVTALYELTPTAGQHNVSPSTAEDRRYQQTQIKGNAYGSGEIAFVQFRYKLPRQTTSILLSHPITNPMENNPVSEDFSFCAAVASWGMILQDSKYKGSVSNEQIIQLAENSIGEDINGYRKQFIDLVRKSAALKN